MSKIGLFPGAFKPLQIGHWRAIKVAASKVDKLFLLVSFGDRIRPNEFPIYGKDMKIIWDKLLKKHLPKNTTLIASKAPVGDVYKILKTVDDKKSPNTFIIFSDSEDINKNYPSKYIDKYKNIKIDLIGIPRTSTVDVSGTDMREFLKSGDKNHFKALLPEVLSDKEKEFYWKQLQLDKVKTENYKKFISGIMLNEAKEGKNLHLEHIEDLVFDYGQKGLDKVNSYFKQISNYLENKDHSIQISQKWDGSFAIFSGVNPDTNQFFVGTKSVFSKEPKICYSEADVDKYYSDKPDLAAKLGLCFKYLSTLGLKDIIQGDFLYQKKDLVVKKLNDKDSYVFTPNTITYAVPIDSNLGTKMKQSKLGIVFHTLYKGDKMSDMKVVSGINIDAFKGKNQDVLLLDAYLPKREGSSTTLRITAPPALKTKGSEDMVTIRPVDFMKRANISAINKNETITDFVKTTTEWIKNYTRKEKDKLKTDKKKAEWDAILEQDINIINKNKEYINEVYAKSQEIVAQKNKIINALEESNNVKTYFGNEPTGSEGFVVIDGDSSIKLVNRKEFSRLNATQNPRFEK